MPISPITYTKEEKEEEQEIISEFALDYGNRQRT